MLSLVTHLDTSITLVDQIINSIGRLQGPRKQWGASNPIPGFSSGDDRPDQTD